MKIALIHYKLVRKGGLETRLLNYIEHLVAMGHQISVICVRYDSRIQLPEHVKVIKLKLGIVPNPLRKWYFDVKLKKLMTELQFDFSLSLGRTSHQDAVLAPSNHLGYLKALGLKKRSVGDYLQIHLDKQSYLKSKVIFAASQMMKEELINLYAVDPAKIKVLYPPLDTLRFNRNLRQNAEKLKDKFGVDPRKKSFVFVTTNMHLKGIKLLIEVFSNLDKNSCELFVTGTSQDNIEYENIKFLGYVNNIQELYAACDYLIHPSKFDGFGQIVSEALQCGMPVIISENTGAKEIITDSVGIVVKGFEVEDWRNAILESDNHRFNIPLNFAEENSLSVTQHLEKMLQLWADVNP